MSIVTSRASIIVELAEALGVPKSAKSFTLHVEANSPLTLTVVHYLDERTFARSSKPSRSLN